AEHDGIGHPAGRFDDAGVGQLCLQFHDARLDESLAFLRGIVLCILAQIAMSTGFGNRFDIFGTLDFAKAIELCLKCLVPLSGDRCRHDLGVLYGWWGYSGSDRMVSSFLSIASMPITAARAPRMVV